MGALQQQLTYLNCPHHKERDEEFFSLCVEVKNQGDLTKSLESLNEPEMLEGIICGSCGKKDQVAKAVKLKKIPRYFFIGLKRMELDFETMDIVKINDYFEFPIMLDFYPYTNKYEIGKQKAENQIQPQQNAGDEEIKESFTESQSTNSIFKYKLVGILLHNGTAKEGDYLTLVQDRFDIYDGKFSEGRWYEFNGSKVGVFDPVNIPSEAFGGAEKDSKCLITENK